MFLQIGNCHLAIADAQVSKLKFFGGLLGFVFLRSRLCIGGLSRSRLIRCCPLSRGGLALLANGGKIPTSFRRRGSSLMETASLSAVAKARAVLKFLSSPMTALLT